MSEYESGGVSLAENIEKDTVEEPKTTTKSKAIKVLRIASVALLAALIILGGTAAGVFFAMREIGKNSLANRREEETGYDDYEYDPDLIRFNGETYRYNSALTNILFMGIDKKELGNPDNSYAGGGFSDVLLLGVLDEKNSRLTVISIDRNTVVPVQSYDGEGKPLGTTDAQIARAFSYGDGREKSIALTEDAVSELLYGIPIHARYAMSVSAVGTVNDMIGGVTVTLNDDMTIGKKKYKAGDKVTLKGDNASAFLQARIGVGDDSNAQRIGRQQQYLSAFVQKAKSTMKGDFSLVGKIFDKVMQKSCTDLKASEAVYLASVASELEIKFVSIAGRTVLGEENADLFYPDTDALYQSIIDVFYIKEG